MRIAGVICEYNPLHNGHKKQLTAIRNKFGSDTCIVCLMSGSFVQRGEPAIFSKTVRTEAALDAGADLVLELPVTYALSSAENFARGGVSILGTFCDFLCFGAESPDETLFRDTAAILLSSEFPQVLHPFLDQGLSFPAAREKALASMGGNPDILRSANNILGIEYCKAITALGCSMTPEIIHRQGDYHSPVPDLDNPSATSLRNCLESGLSIDPFVPSRYFEHAAVHTLAAGERCILARLRTMSDEEFSRIPYGSEGLWRKLMHESRQQPTLERILTAVKSKRYTRSRLNRMVLCAFLGITESDLYTPVPYVRVLGFNQIGRQILHNAKESIVFRNAGEKTDDPYWDIEHRCGSLYGLFAKNRPDPPDLAKKERVIVRI